MQKSSTVLSVTFSKKPVFQKGAGNWIDVLPTKTKRNKDIKLCYTNVTPIQPSLKKKEDMFIKSY